MNITASENDGKTIFVFGSNLAGRHGAGAAYTARMDWGAEIGVGLGRTGMAYAIPTKNTRLKPLPLPAIKGFVLQFIDYTRTHPELRFLMTRIGCGLAGYKNHEIAPFFITSPTNVILPVEWDF